jgi:imidazolonepropionase-like amidohydrolase
MKARLVVRTWIGAASVVAALAAGVATAQQATLVLEGGTLIDGTGRPPVANAVVIVEGTRIKTIGTKGRVSYPASATVIHLDGRTILPGLIDGHVHLQDWEVPMFLPYGITTIADLHNDTAWSIAEREALKSGRIKGPRLFVSGARVTGPLGPPTTDGSYVKDAAEARAYVRTLKAAGVDHVKVDLTITDDQLRAVIEECKAQGLPLLGHTQNIQKAVDMGFTHMEHTDTMARALLAQAGREAPRGVVPESLVDPKTFPPLIDFLTRHKVYVNPTLFLMWSGTTERWRDWTADGMRLAAEPNLAFVPANVRAAWSQQPRPREGYANVAAFLKMYSQAGGRILAATDAVCGGCNQIIPGLSLHYEMQLLTDMGIPPMKALQGATLWSAEAIGQEKDLGSIEPGKLADFTVIEGNPLADIGATKKVRMVIKGGAVMDTSYDPTWTNPVPRRIAQ